LVKVCIQRYDASAKLFQLWGRQVEFRDVPSKQIFAVSQLIASERPVRLERSEPPQPAQQIYQAEIALFRQLNSCDRLEHRSCVGELQCGVIIIEHVHAMRSLGWPSTKDGNSALARALTTFTVEMTPTSSDFDILIQVLRGLPAAFLPCDRMLRGCAADLDWLDHESGTLQRAWRQIEASVVLTEVAACGRLLVSMTESATTRRDAVADFTHLQWQRRQIRNACQRIKQGLPSEQQALEELQRWCSEVDDEQFLSRHGIERRDPHHKFLGSRLQVYRSDVVIEYDGAAVPTSAVLVYANTRASHRGDGPPCPVAEVMHVIHGECCDAALLLAKYAVTTPDDVVIKASTDVGVPTMVYHPNLELTNVRQGVRTGMGRHLKTRPFKVHSTVVRRGQALDFNGIRALLDRLVDCGAVIVQHMLECEANEHGRHVSYLITPSSCHVNSNCRPVLINGRQTRETPIPSHYKVVLLWKPSGMQHVMPILNMQQGDVQIPMAVPASEAALYLLSKGVSCPWVQDFCCSDTRQAGLTAIAGIASTADDMLRKMISYKSGRVCIHQDSGGPHRLVHTLGQPKDEDSTSYTVPLNELYGLGILGADDSGSSPDICKSAARNVMSILTQCCSLTLLEEHTAAAELLEESICFDLKLGHALIELSYLNRRCLKSGVYLMASHEGLEVQLLEINDKAVCCHDLKTAAAVAKVERSLLCLTRSELRSLVIDIRVAMARLAQPKKVEGDGYLTYTLEDSEPLTKRDKDSLTEQIRGQRQLELTLRLGQNTRGLLRNGFDTRTVKRFEQRLRKLKCVLQDQVTTQMGAEDWALVRCHVVDQHRGDECILLDEMDEAASPAKLPTKPPTHTCAYVTRTRVANTPFRTRVRERAQNVAPQRTGQANANSKSSGALFAQWTAD